MVSGGERGWRVVVVVVVGEGDVGGECRWSVGGGDCLRRVCGGDDGRGHHGVCLEGERLSVLWVKLVSRHTVPAAVACCNNRSSL